MNERIKTIRKHFKLSQTEFGAKLGVSRDTIANIEGNRIDVKDVFAKLICREFNVNEEWLRTGNGEMFAETVDEYINKFNLDELGVKIVKTYLTLNDEQRALVKEIIKKLNS